METLSHANFLVFNRVVGEIYSAYDLESFYITLFNSMQLVIPYDYSSFKDINPFEAIFIKTENGSKIGHNDSDVCFPVTHEDFSDQPLIPYCQSGSVITASTSVSLHSFKNMPVYDNYCRLLGGDKQIAFSIPVSHEKVSLIALHRKQSDFCERERLVLSLLRLHLITAIWNVIALGRIKSERDFLQRITETEQRGVILVRPDGRIVYTPDFAVKPLEKHFRSSFQEGEVLPDDFLQWFQSELRTLQQRSQLKITEKSPSSDRSRNVEQKTIIIEENDKSFSMKLLDESTNGEQRIFIVETDRTMLIKKMNIHGLSCRETEVLLWIAKGKSSQETAVILKLSRRTIEKHLEHVFFKLGVETRAGAIAILKQELLSLAVLH